MHTYTKTFCILSQTHTFKYLRVYAVASTRARARAHTHTDTYTDTHLYTGCLFRNHPRLRKIHPAETSPGLSERLQGSISCFQCCAPDSPVPACIIFVPVFGRGRIVPANNYAQNARGFIQAILAKMIKKNIDSFWHTYLRSRSIHNPSLSARRALHMLSTVWVFIQRSICDKSIHTLCANVQHEHQHT